jgi:uncharacterized protein YdhG (YjbR/CyaY superfamily)
LAKGDSARRGRILLPVPAGGSAQQTPSAGRVTKGRVVEVVEQSCRGSRATFRACHDVGMGEVSDYIAGRGDPARSVLEQYRARAVAAVPEAEEGTSYGMAALRYRGRPLISVVSTKQGYSVFPFSPAVVESVIAQLDGFESTKGGIKFTDKRHLPDTAFDALVARRRDEIDTALSNPRRR